jgi:hypothetical protein
MGLGKYEKKIFIRSELLGPGKADSVMNDRNDRQRIYERVYRDVSI